MGEPDRLAGAGGRKPQIDQFDRLAFEEEGISLAVEPAELVYQSFDPISRHRPGLRQRHG